MDLVVSASRARTLRRRRSADVVDVLPTRARRLRVTGRSRHRRRSPRGSRGALCAPTSRRPQRVHRAVPIGPRPSAGDAASTSGRLVGRGQTRSPGLTTAASCSSGVGQSPDGLDDRRHAREFNHRRELDLRHAQQFRMRTLTATGTTGRSSARCPAVGTMRRWPFGCRDNARIGQPATTRRYPKSIRSESSSPRWRSCHAPDCRSLRSRSIAGSTTLSGSCANVELAALMDGSR